ncbi:hypothetical protein GCM10009560_20750 [Nonomuraea longicatena]|uniref:Uncharacterized protein n=1 Tax=Nonomuraea longicatena TaxID=83682 RepID=A0ABN1P2S8_9ACTN
MASAGKSLLAWSATRITRSGPVGFATGIRHLPSPAHPRREITMYEMYPWNRADEHEDEAAEAVQFALDRRDNGGTPDR